MNTKVARDPKTGRFISLKKLNEFNFAEFRNGKPAYNKLGNKVYFRAIDNNNKDMMVVSVCPRFGLPYLMKMKITGKKYSYPTAFDLKTNI